ncbi:MAG: hypothetical protein ACO1SX_20685 [Actinomycetota bacterium]
MTVGEVNQQIEEALASAGRVPNVTEDAVRRARECAGIVHEIQLAIQNALFDCEHEIRELREREVSPAELLVDGERLINRYRFIRRRARVIDGMLAFLPLVTAHMTGCVENLRQMSEEDAIPVAGPLTVPDCEFAMVALEALREEEAAARLPRL